MFSKKTLQVIGVFLLVVGCLLVISMTSSRQRDSTAGGIAIVLVAPFQNLATQTLTTFRSIWNNYFNLVSVAGENVRLRMQLNKALARANQCRELELSNQRLRRLLDFSRQVPGRAVAAEIIGRDPSPWFEHIVINKGRAAGIEKGFAVVVPEGIVGQVVEVSPFYSKVMLIIDQSSGVDALIQDSRARGIVKGRSARDCVFEYVLRKHAVEPGAAVVSSGLDGVFPKGLRIGRVSQVVERGSGIFQDISVSPYVHFESLEEVLVILGLQPASGDAPA